MSSNPSVNKGNIIKIADKVRANCRYKSDAHFKAARRWARFHFLLGIPTVILASITSAASFGKLFPNKDIIIGILATVVAALSALITFLIPNDKASSHHIAGIKYHSLKNKAHSFSSIEAAFLESEVELYEKLKQLIDQVEEVDKSSPLVYGLTARDFRTIKRLRGMIYKYLSEGQRKTID